MNNSCLPPDKIQRNQAIKDIASRKNANTAATNFIDNANISGNNWNVDNTKTPIESNRKKLDDS